ncbi:hypothetical protein FRB99_007112 [Tulasnella sp. 403]|nr:hypothetical protein FRB99_007112 [Tulasnella sp. 403]
MDAYSYETSYDGSSASPEGDTEVKDLQVTFTPQLWLQRRTWVLNQLRKEKSTSVIDLGCGEGSLLAVLVEPATCFPDPNPKSTNRLYTDKSLDIYATHIVGLDIDPIDLATAVAATVPDSIDGTDLLPWERPRPRWVDLTVDIWRGGLEMMNGNPDDGWFGQKEWDAIVSTEVVEHLPHDILPYFFPVTLGIYRPKVLLLTTPNYNFNQRFVPPDRSHLDREKGYPDPTGVTDRVFRHADHKREWREEEWGDWCRAGATEWGYSVELGSLGVADEPDPWERESIIGKASLTAMFHRMSDDGDGEIRRRRERALEDARLRSSQADETTAHRLVAQHAHVAHPSAGKPQSRESILAELREVLRDGGELGLNEGKALVEEVWMRDKVATACGGLVDALFDAIDNAPTPSAQDTNEWVLIRDTEDTYLWREPMWSWRILWRGFVKTTPPSTPATSVYYEEMSDWDPTPYEEEVLEEEENPSSDTLASESTEEFRENREDWRWGWGGASDTSPEDNFEWGAGDANNGGWGGASPSWGSPIVLAE